LTECSPDGSQTASRLLRDPCFFVRRHHVDRRRRIIRADLPRRSWVETDRCVIAIRVEADSAPFHVVADSPSHLRGVFPDPPPEDDSLRPTQYRQVPPEIFAYPIAEQINGQLGSLVPLLSGCAQQFPHVVRSSGKPK